MPRADRPPFSNEPEPAGLRLAPNPDYEVDPPRKVRIRDARGIDQVCTEIDAGKLFDMAFHHHTMGGNKPPKEPKR